MGVALLTGLEDIIERNPSWPRIEAEIRRLNGETHNYLSVRLDDIDKWLAIGGGDEHFLLFFHRRGEGSYFLVSEKLKDSQESISMVLGDHDDDWPAKFAVELEDVLKASVYFIEKEEMKPGMVWEKWRRED